MKMQTVKSQKGFSLIELMIVVAIIGILATIAVPNFNRFQVKARQAEAKTNLSAIYTGEKAFFTEWNGYTSDLRDIGVNLEGRLRYNVGFAGAGYVPPLPFAGSTAGGCAAGATTNATSACACITTAGVAGCTWATGAAVAFAGMVAGACGSAGLNPTQTNFVAAAMSTVASVGGTRPDQWTMTEDKQLCNNQNAL